MNCKLFQVVLGNLLWLSLGAIASGQSSARDEAARLQDLWARQRQEIRTATITADHFVYYPARVPKGAVESFLAEIERKLENGIDQVDFPTLTKSLPPDMNKRHDWQRLSLVLEGARCRAQWQWQTPDGRPRVTTLAFDGACEVHWRDSARQANLYRGRTAMAIPDLCMFRMIPCLPPDAAVGRDQAQLSISGNGWTMYVDPQDGLLREAVLGETAVLQRGAKEFAGGITFPRLVLRLRYHGNLLNKLEMLRIIEARFNEPLPRDAFHVALEADTTIVDARVMAEPPEVYRLTKAVDSAAAVDADGPNVNRSCRPPHELIGKNADLTACKLFAAQCILHDPSLDRRLIDWLGAACTDPRCRVRQHDPRQPPPGLDLWMNMYQLACQIETTDRGLTCRRVMEYLPSYRGRPSLAVCMARDAK